MRCHSVGDRAPPTSLNFRRLCSCSVTNASGRGVQNSCFSFYAFGYSFIDFLFTESLPAFQSYTSERCSRPSRDDVHVELLWQAVHGVPARVCWPPAVCWIPHRLLSSHDPHRQGQLHQASGQRRLLDLGQFF